MKISTFTVIRIAFVSMLASVALALTPAERSVLRDARSQLKTAISQFQDVNVKLGDAGKQIEAANQHAAEADGRAAAAETHAASADQHAAETDAKAKKTGEEIETAHKNEQTMANAVAVMKPIYDQVYKYWGIGAIILGFQILGKHLLILAAVLIGIGLALWIASFFTPVIGIGLTAARKIIAAIIARFSMVVHKTAALKTVVQKASTTALAAETGLVEAVTRKRVVTPSPKPNP